MVSSGVKLPYSGINYFGPFSVNPADQKFLKYCLASITIPCSKSFTSPSVGSLEHVYMPLTG